MKNAIAVLSFSLVALSCANAGWASTVIFEPNAGGKLAVKPVSGQSRVVKPANPAGEPQAPPSQVGADEQNGTDSIDNTPMADDLDELESDYIDDEDTGHAPDAGDDSETADDEDAGDDDRDEYQDEDDEEAS